MRENDQMENNKIIQQFYMHIVVNWTHLKYQSGFWCKVSTSNMITANKTNEHFKEFFFSVRLIVVSAFNDANVPDWNIFASVVWDLGTEMSVERIHVNVQLYTAHNGNDVEVFKHKVQRHEEEQQNQMI